MRALADPPVRLFTVQEYHRMGEAAVFGPDERVELIRGVIHKMSPKGRRHSAAVSLLSELFVARLAGRCRVFPQDALRIQEWHSEPEPDIIIASNPDPMTYGTPESETVMVVEVADSSLNYDRDVKAPLFAEAEIPEYWLVNLVEDVIEVYRAPKDGHYPELSTFRKGERIRTLAWPEIEVSVDALIPARRSDAG